MEIVPNGFNVTSSEEIGGNRIAYPALRSTFPILNKSRGYPVGMARVNIKNPDPNGANAYVDYSIPVDSKININIFQNRQGGNSGCERRINTYSSPDLYAQATYTNFQNWFEGDNIAQLISQGSIADVGACPLGLGGCCALIVIHRWITLDGHEPRPERVPRDKEGRGTVAPSDRRHKIGLFLKLWGFGA